MVRPCVARVFVEIAVSGLASMYPTSGHLPPSLDRCVIVDARHKGIASPLGRDVGSLSDDEPGGGALRVVFRH